MNIGAISGRITVRPTNKKMKRAKKFADNIGVAVKDVAAKQKIQPPVFPDALKKARFS